MKHDLNYYRLIQRTNGVRTQKEARVREFRRDVDQCFRRTLNWETAMVNGVAQELEIVPTKEMVTKGVKTRPDQIIRLGDIIIWRNTRWIVNTLDADNQINYRATMVQCNICLRWQLKDGTIHEEYGWDKDASKYSYGETRSSYMDTAQFNMKAIFQINEYTMQIRRDRRFLLGLHGEGLNPLAVAVSRINSIVNSYEYMDEDQKDTGLYEITIHETQFNPDTDNVELGVADYVDPEVLASMPETDAVPETASAQLKPLDPVVNEKGEWF